MIDAQRVEEFLSLIHDRIGEDVLQHLAVGAAAKHRRLAGLLDEHPTDENAGEVLTHVFAARRPLRFKGVADRILSGAEWRSGGAGTGSSADGDGKRSGLAPVLGRLLNDGDPVERRLEDFARDWGETLGPSAMDVATDILHFLQPDRYWLWTRWIWDPAGESGLLPLLGALPPGCGDGGIRDNYLLTGEALAHLREILGERLAPLGPEPFGLDIFLATTYSLYSYLVTSVRTTEEFAGILPRPAEMAARLLGIGAWMVGDGGRGTEGKRSEESPSAAKVY